MSKKNRNFQKYAEIFAEFDIEFLVTQKFAADLGYRLIGETPDQKLLKRDNYLDSFRNEMDQTQFTSLCKEIDQLSDYSKSSADSIYQAIKTCHPGNFAGVGIKVTGYTKLGLKEGVSQKADLLVEVINGSQSTEYLYSIKQYRKCSNLQVASGTYVSTLCGLAFDVCGRGKFSTVSGETFMSKDKESACKHVARFYGDEAADILSQIYSVDNIYAPMRATNPYPGDEVWKNTCKKVKEAAIPLFLSFLEIVAATNSARFAERLVHRSGLTNDDEVVYTTKVEGEVVSFNTLSDSAFSKLMNCGSLKDIRASFCRSGQDGEGGGVDAQLFDSQGESLIKLHIPLTINKNGAWQLSAQPGRFCRKDGAYIEYGGLRPEKAKEMATSTNTWLDIMPTLKTVLSGRRLAGEMEVL